MLKFQIILIVLLISCVAFVACERTAQVLEPVIPDSDMTDTNGMTDDGMTDDSAADDGMADDGAVDDGTTDDGMTNDTAADDATTDDGTTDDGAVDDSMTDDGDVMMPQRTTQQLTMLNACYTSIRVDRH